MRFKVHKNKTGVPQRSGNYDFYFDEGGAVNPGEIDIFKDVVQEAIAYGVIETAGSWMTYKDVKVQGADKMVYTLRDRDDLYKELWDETFNFAMDKIPEEEKDVAQFDEKLVNTDTGEILEDNSEKEKTENSVKKGSGKKKPAGKKTSVKKKTVFDK